MSSSKSGLIDRVGGEVAKSLELSRCAIISDEVVASLFADRLTTSLSSAGFDSTLITIPPGEKSKSLEQAGAICERMATAGLDRSSFVVALGGGVVGDLAGFVAAIYHRGIPYVQVPTTLLAQVDSSIGGKTAVNTAAGKNLIGALHHPVLVIADIDLLQTLPEREFNQGFAEIIKHGIIRDAALLDTLESFERKRIWNRSLGEMSKSRRSSSRRMSEMRMANARCSILGTPWGTPSRGRGTTANYCMARRSVLGSSRPAIFPCVRWDYRKTSARR